MRRPGSTTALAGSARPVAPQVLRLACQPAGSLPAVLQRDRLTPPRLCAVAATAVTGGKGEGAALWGSRHARNSGTPPWPTANRRRCARRRCALQPNRRTRRAPDSAAAISRSPASPLTTHPGSLLAAHRQPALTAQQSFTARQQPALNVAQQQPLTPHAAARWPAADPACCPAAFWPRRGPCSLLARLDHVVDLEDHLADLRRQEELLALGQVRLEHVLLTHVVRARLVAVDAQVRVGLLNLALAHRRERLNRRQARVLRERERDRLERVGKCAHRILLHADNVVRSVLNRKRAADLRRAAAVDDGVVAHEVARNADCVVQRALDLVEHHLIAAAHKDCDGLHVGAALDDEHLVLGRAERHLAHRPRKAQLLGREL
mmetsp:Transcript_36731/g.108310  ORF Transcript_36731/g.108310 Transcript_36731/m.108310 type:complete len:377 (+) Transcript_36731:177-1307(+)